MSSWMILSATEGTGNKQFTIGAEDLNSTAMREGVVTVTEDSGRKANVRAVQYGKPSLDRRAPYNDIIAGGGGASVSITSYGRWCIVAEPSMPNWVTIMTDDGDTYDEGDWFPPCGYSKEDCPDSTSDLWRTFGVNFGQNTTTLSRSVRLKLRYHRLDGTLADSDFIEIRQQGIVKDIDVPSTPTTKGETTGGETTWVATTDAEWITITKRTGNKGEQVTFETTENTGYKREGLITITYSDGTVELMRVRQKAGVIEWRLIPELYDDYEQRFENDILPANVDNYDYILFPYESSVPLDEIEGLRYRCSNGWKLHGIAEGIYSYVAMTPSENTGNNRTLWFELYNSDKTSRVEFTQRGEAEPVHRGYFYFGHIIYDYSTGQQLNYLPADFEGRIWVDYYTDLPRETIMSDFDIDEISDGLEYVGVSQENDGMVFKVSKNTGGIRPLTCSVKSATVDTDPVQPVYFGITQDGTGDTWRYFINTVEIDVSTDPYVENWQPLTGNVPSSGAKLRVNNISNMDIFDPYNHARGDAYVFSSVPGAGAEDAFSALGHEGMFLIVQPNTTGVLRRIEVTSYVIDYVNGTSKMIKQSDIMLVQDA